MPCEDKVTFELEGEAYAALRATSSDRNVWYVPDSAFLHVDGIDVPKGSEHEVAVVLRFRAFNPPANTAGTPERMPPFTRVNAEGGRN